MALKRDLGLLEATTIVVGSMIGSGIFLGVDAAARLVPSGPILLLVFLFSGLLVLFGALTYGELASIMPESGGHYAYIRNAYGPLLGFLQGWNIFTIAKSASVSALAVAFATYLGFLVDLTPLAAKTVAIALIVLLSLANIVGVRYAGMLSNASTFAKVGALVVLVLGGLLVAGGVEARAPAAPIAGGAGLLSAFGAAMVFAMFAYDGWANSTQVAEEVREPQRNVPRSLVLGVLLVMGVYLAVLAVYLLVLGAGGLAATDFPAPEVARTFAGETGAVLVVLAVLVSIFGTTNAVILSGPRIYFAMARDGYFPRRVADVHPRFGTPVWSIVAQAAWSILLALSGTFDQLLTTVIFTSWIFYGLGAFVVVLWRRRHPDLARPYRVPGYPLVPWLFVVASAVFTLNTFVTSPVESLAGCLILASGLPVYAWYARQRRVRAGAGLRLTEEESLVEAYVRRLADDGRAWDGRRASDDLGIAPDRLYAIVAGLPTRTGGRIEVRYVDGALAVRPTDGPGRSTG